MSQVVRTVVVSVRYSMNDHGAEGAAYYEKLVAHIRALLVTEDELQISGRIHSVDVEEW